MKRGGKKVAFLVIGMMIFLSLGVLVWVNVFGLYDASTDFSPDKFVLVSTGMTPAEVQSILGTPLKKVEVGAWNEACSEYWEYSKKPFYSLAYKRFTVFFDRQKRVARTTIQMDS